MYFEEIDGERQLDFVRKFDYIREAGTEGEQKAFGILLCYHEQSASKTVSIWLNW